MGNPAAPPRSAGPGLSRRARSTVVGVIGGLGALLLALTPLRMGPRPRPGVEATPVELLQNGRFEGALDTWGAAGSGFEAAPSEGRSGSQALLCATADAAGFQTLRLDRALMLPLRISGWSRAHEVDGAPGEDYSLHASVEYQDGTRLDGVSVPFDCGTHGWQRRELRLPASKPVKTLVLHVLFRNHRGRVWFDDLSVEELRPEEGTILFEGTPLHPDPARRRSSSPSRTYETNDGLRLDAVDETLRSLTLNGHECRPQGSAGFLVRDAGRDGAWQPLDATTLQELRLSFESRWQSSRDHVSIEGELRDLSGADRAVSLAFALPVELENGFWADDVRRSRQIGPAGEYVNVVPVPCGSTGSLSRYPLGAVFDARIGVALAADMEFPAQFRIGYHAGLRQLFISYDFGILPDAVFLPGRARFRFVLYRVDPTEGFRGALQRLYSVFPAAFSRRCLEAGAWLPFTPPEKIPHWEDFGFAFHETIEDAAPTGASLPLRFRYREPLGFWLPLPPDAARSQDDLLSRLRTRTLSSPAMPLDLLERRAMKTPAGLPQFRFRREPWCDGVVFSMNPNPRLPGAAASVDGPAGEFIDSVEGYAMAELDFDRNHLRHATVAPTYSIDTRVPVLFKGQAIHEYAKEVARKLRGKNRLVFGNGTPERFSFLAPHFDILGTEVDWFAGGAFVPPSDADLIFRRTLAFQKPYCILLNTPSSNLTPENLERYFQRCLFYGMFPSLFSHDAQNDSYWEDAERMERDRPLFKKYLPLIRRSSVAGWQPLTGARVDNPAILIERFGPDARGVIYLSLLNDGPTDQEVRVTLEPPRPARSRVAEARELITELAVPVRDGTLRIAVPAGASRLIELRVRDQK
ncbi:MAG TPA: hypothetical protein VNM14_01880 [Planctomycetota bacterium]|nr:hypothetical protein [Planctomycetota bacterium]